MRELTIKNFRCYEEKNIEFRSGINLLVGDNAVGKTSLLSACNYAMNAFFSGYSDENTVWKGLANDDFRDTGIAEKPIEISFKLGSWDIVTDKATNDKFKGLFDKLKIEKKTKKGSRYIRLGLKPLTEYAAFVQQHSHTLVDGSIQQKDISLPLYACFTTEDIHSVRKFDKQKFKKPNPKPSFGYFECSDSKGLLDCWLKRLLVLKEAKIGQDEIDTVQNAIKDALGENGCGIISEMDIRVNDGNVYFKFTDGRAVAAHLLSDGYRRLVGIVVDIAFRCALLNKAMWGKDCYKHTYGTVIIDEIDEHLHPSLQEKILNSLHQTFPKIQFIVSTHAPLVMSSVKTTKENVVYKLEYDAQYGYTHRILEPYGVDANLILEESMDVNSRAPEVEKAIKEIETLVSEKRIQEAEAKMRQLESISDPQQLEFVSLRAMIGCEKLLQQ